MFHRSLRFGWGVVGAALVATSSFELGAQDAFINDTGGISAQLVIGPIDPGRNTSPNGICSDGGRFGSTDYLTNADGSVSERNLLVGEGDEVRPDFGRMAGAARVKPSPNPGINPDAAEGVLTVWATEADFDGYIDYNQGDKIGDPVDDYIVYSIIYLENTTGECLSVVLEVGSDDAVKTLVNGALVHVNNVCRGIPGIGAGDRVPVTLVPGSNVVLTAVTERGGGTGVRLVLRDTDDLPLVDGSVEASLIPPEAYPEGGGARITRKSTGRYSPGQEVTIELIATGIPMGAATTITETVPQGWSVTSNPAGGTVVGNTIAFTLMGDAELSYGLTPPADDCDVADLEGVVAGAAAAACGELPITGSATLRCVPVPAGATVFTFDNAPGPAADSELSDFFNFLGFATSIGASGWRIDPNRQNPNDDTGALHTTSDGEQLNHFFSRVAVLKPSVFQAQDVFCQADITWDDMGGDANDHAGVYVRFNGTSNDPLQNSYYFLRVDAGEADSSITLHRVKNGIEQALVSAQNEPFLIVEGDTVTVTVEAVGEAISVAIDGEPVLGMDPYVDADPILECGSVGVGQNTNPAYFDNLTFMAVAGGAPCACPLVTRAFELPEGDCFEPGDGIKVTLTASDVTGAVSISDTVPEGFSITDAGSGTVAGGTVTFELNANGSVSYTAVAPMDGAPPAASFDGQATSGDCERAVSGESRISRCEVVCEPDPDAPEAELILAFHFSAFPLECEVDSAPGEVYTQVLQTSDLEIEYDERRGWGYEVLDEFAGGYLRFGQLDDSPNDRGDFGGDCPERLYDTFIGGKNWLTPCDQNIVDPPDPNVPCDTEDALFPEPPESIIFRVDVPEGKYRFVGAFGDADNVHAHRIVVENGGEGPAEELGDEHVVLVHQFDQAQQTIGETEPTEPGEGVFARVGFDGRIPPPGDGEFPSPQFVNMDELGMETVDCPSSPILEVTEGYIRLHQMQGNSNDGPGGPFDPNGGDAVIFEVWRIIEPAGATLKPGDINGDGGFNISDPVAHLNFLFAGGALPECYTVAGSDPVEMTASGLAVLDFNGDGGSNIADAVGALNFLFGGGGPHVLGEGCAEVDGECVANCQ